MLTSSEVFVGIATIFALAAACQVVATRLRLPSIVLYLPAGFAAGVVTHSVDPTKLLGASFSPLVTLAVAVILFDGGLDLDFSELEGHSKRVVRRLLFWGVPITWAGAASGAVFVLGLPRPAAVMLGAILVVSGPTVVGPLLALCRPGRRLQSILAWEGTMIDPIGAIIGVLVFEALSAHVDVRPLVGLVHFAADVGIGLAFGAVGTLVLWVLLTRFEVKGVLATEVTLATVVAVSGICDAVREDTGLMAAIAMGVALANIPAVRSPEDRPFFQTVVQLVIGLLFVSISATVTPDSLHGLVLPTLGLLALLALVVRPLVSALATMRTDLTRNERIFIGAMDPRGIVAASTAATFGVSLVAAGVPGASKLLPATFLVVVGTVALYGFLATPLARGLGLTGSAEEDVVDGEDVPTTSPPPAPGEIGRGGGEPGSRT